MNQVVDVPRASIGRGGTLLATSLGFGVVQLDVSVVNVAITPIGADLGGGVAALQWVVNAYTLAFAGLILTAGALGDRIGAKRVFVAGFALFTVASAACGLAPDLAVLIAARAVQGVGAAVLVPCSLALLNHAYPAAHERARAIGLWTAGASTALSAGPLIGGVLTTTLGWRAIFFINAPIGLAGILVTLRWATQTSRSSGRGIDLPGQFAAVLTLTALAGAMIEGGQRGFTDSAVLAGFAVAVLAGAAFVLIEARGARPMLPLRLFRAPSFGPATTIGLLVNIAFYGLLFVLSLFFQREQHHSALVTGLAFAPMTVAIIGANLTTSRLAQGLGARRLIIIGALLMAAGCAGLLGFGATATYPMLVAQLTALGFGLGLIVPAMTATLLGAVARERSGVAAGTLNTARQTGSVLGVALFGALIAGPGSLVPGWHVALLISIGLLAVIVAISFRIGSSTPRASCGTSGTATTASARVS
jgi:DHA2 family methylenomycin A resistance protein-like MFS transporter